MAIYFKVRTYSVVFLSMSSVCQGELCRSLIKQDAPKNPAVHLPTEVVKLVAVSKPCALQVACDRRSPQLMLPLKGIPWDVNCMCDVSDLY